MTWTEYLKSRRTMSEAEVARVTAEHDALTVPPQVRREASQGHAQSMVRGNES